MFTQKGLLFGIFVSFPLSLVLKQMDARGVELVLSDTVIIPVHLEFIASMFFIIGAACIGLFLLSIFALGILPILGGGSNVEKEISIDDFTLDELRGMDREDEPYWNESHRQNASAAWDGMNGSPVYEDYRGMLRDAHTNAFICDNHTDQRRVIGGKVVCFGGKAI